MCNTTRRCAKCFAANGRQSARRIGPGPGLRFTVFRSGRRYNSRLSGRPLAITPKKLYHLTCVSETSIFPRVTCGIYTQWEKSCISTHTNKNLLNAVNLVALRKKKKKDEKYDLVCLHVLPICSLAILNLLLPTFDIVC